MSTRLDLDGDELIDLAVGAHGSAVLLRWGGGIWEAWLIFYYNSLFWVNNQTQDLLSLLPSSRSIVQINVSLSFQPHSINVIQKTCQRGGRESACLNATACFTTVSRSPGPQSNSFGRAHSQLSFMTVSGGGATHAHHLSHPPPACLPGWLPPQTSGFPPPWTTGSCLRGRCLMTARTARASWLSRFTRAEPSAARFPFTFT